MKKYLSILLVLVILISSVCSTSVFAGMENTNFDWTDASKWIFNASDSQNIDNNTGAKPYIDGDGVTVDTTTFADRGTTLKLDSGSFYASLPLNTEPNTDYKLTFSYCSTVVANSLSVKDKAPYAFNSAGIFIPNHPAFDGVNGSRLGYGYTMTYLVNYASNYQMYTPAGRNWDGPTTKNKVDQNGDGNPEDGRKYDVLPKFHNIEVNTWYTLSYNFNSSDFEDIAFTFQKVAGGEMWIDDIVLEKNIEDNDDYFEDNNNWIMSIRGDAENRKNIATTREQGKYSYGWSDKTTQTNTTDSANGDGRCIKTTWPDHAYNIPLSGLEKNSTYSIEFYYKVLTQATDGVDTDAAFNAMGVYSPKFMNDKLTAEGADISNLKFDNCTVGWAAVDRVIGGKYYRYRDDTLEKGAVTANRYFEDTDGDYTYAGIQGRWIKEKIEFSVKDYNDLHLVIIPGKTSSILLDDFSLKKISSDFSPSDYFENADNWILSLRGSQTDRRNVSVDGTDVEGASSSGLKGSGYFAVDNTVSLDGQGSSVKLNWATHPSNIALPNLEYGKSYRLKFSFKVASNSSSVVANPQIKGIGIYSPKKMEDAITAGDNTSRFTDGTLGWNVFDSYNGTGGIKRYRDETLTSCAANKNSYATVAGDYTYNTANQWYTEELYFKVTEYTDLQLVIIPGDDNSGTFLDNFEFEMVEKVPDELIPGSTPNPGPEGPEVPGEFDSYFETPSKWGASVGGSTSYPCKNILVNGISDTTVATAIEWASFTKDTGVKAGGSDSSLLISNPNHVSHIKLPDTEVNANYRLKFAYKPTGGTEGKNVLKFTGIFDPEFLQEKISTDSTINYFDLKNGFSVVDSYAGNLQAGRYRFTNGVYPSDNSPVNYGRLNNNIYNENDWQYIEFYFTVTEKLDNPYLLISYATEAGKLYVDDFEFEKVDEIPAELIPGYFDPNYVAPAKTVIDFEGDPSTYSHLTGENVEIAQTKDRNKKMTNALHIKQVCENMENVTFPGWPTVSQRNDPVFTFDVDPGCTYTVSFWIKRDQYTGGASYLSGSNLNVLYDWRGTHSSSMSYSWSYNELYQIGPDVWKQYTFEFSTEPYQRTATFAINAGYSHPGIWFDDIVYSKVPAGFKESTKANYCESPFNLALNSKYGKNAVFTQKKTFKFSLDSNVSYVFGVNLSGKGTFTLAWDEAGTNVIKSYNVAKNKNRIGGVLVTDFNNKDVYIICDPAGSKMSYTDFYFFRKCASGTGRERGYEDDVNARKPVRFTNIPTVSGNSLEEVMKGETTTTDNGDTNNSDSDNGSFIGGDDTYSPSTGDSLTVVMIITMTFVVSLATVMLLGRRRKIK